MALIRNILAIIGAITLIILGAIYTKYSNDLVNLWHIPPEAKKIYSTIWDGLKNTGNIAAASVWEVPLADGISPKDAEEAMALIANEYNIQQVGELSLSEQLHRMTGEKQRLLKIYQYCDPLIAKKMINYHPAYSAYLPCRIAMVEAPDGKVTLYTLNMDFMIHGGQPLPKGLREEALRIKAILLTIMQRGAEGDF